MKIPPRKSWFKDSAAPWPDFAGNVIQVGDTIRHPSGEEGFVVLLLDQADPGDRWRVDYGDGGPLSRLCLQIGNKGQAIVVRRFQ